MNASMDCGSPGCQCHDAAVASPEEAVARVNGVALHRPGERPDVETLRQRAGAELLRQEAVRQGLLPAIELDLAPEVGESVQQVIEAMVERDLNVPTPTEAECQRFYDANTAHFTRGQSVHLRHILFAVTPGVNVHALTIHAERALLELTGGQASEGRFAQLASELSNCPSSAHGGDLGWVGPDDCAPELANELFHQKDSAWGMGVHPRLVHTRFGFHIIEVLGRKKGKLQSYDEARGFVAAQLALRARLKAMQQYVMILAGQADIVGVDLAAASSALVQ